MLLFPLAVYLPRTFFSSGFFGAQGSKGDEPDATTTFRIKYCQQEPRMIF